MDPTWEMGNVTPGDKQLLCRAGAPLFQRQGQSQGRGSAHGRLQGKQEHNTQRLQQAGGGFIEVKVYINNSVPFLEQRQPASPSQALGVPLPQPHCRLGGTSHPPGGGACRDGGSSCTGGQPGGYWNGAGFSGRAL